MVFGILLEIVISFTKDRYFDGCDYIYLNVVDDAGNKPDAL